MRLTEVDNAGGKYLFGYDPTGRRVKKVIESTTGTILQAYAYHYDGSEVAVEYQPSTTWTYYLGLGIDQPVMRTDGTNKQWYYANAQGSISAVADNSGNILEQYEYNAQGQFQVQNGSGTTQAVTRIGNFILYTGRNYDYESGNYFYRARYYSPVLGRFISRDPLSGAEFSQGTNLYAYCRNNFLNLNDPTGEDINWTTMATGGAQMLGAGAGFVLMAASDTLAEAFSGGTATPAVIAGTVVGGGALAGLGADGFANFVGSFTGANPVTAPTSLPGIVGDAIGTQMGGSQWGDAGGAAGDLLSSGAGLFGAASDFSNAANFDSALNTLNSGIDFENSSLQFDLSLSGAVPNPFGS